MLFLISFLQFLQWHNLWGKGTRWFTKRTLMILLIIDHKVSNDHHFICQIFLFHVIFALALSLQRLLWSLSKSLGFATIFCRISGSNDLPGTSSFYMAYQLVEFVAELNFISQWVSKKFPWFFWAGPKYWELISQWSFAVSNRIVYQLQIPNVPNLWIFFAQ